MTILTKTFYIAEDGKEFDSKEDCLDYETKQAREVITMGYDDPYNWLTLLKDKYGTYYVQVDTGDFRSGGTIFDGTFDQFAKKFMKGLKK